MDEEKKPELSSIIKSTALPEIFYSDSTGKPLKECVMCGKNVLEPGTPYLIEKAFRYNKKYDIRDTILEYAVCHECYEKMAAKLSTESLQRMQDYFSNNIHFMLRAEALIGRPEPKLNDWIGKCCVKGTDISDCAEYQVCCQCEGDKMLFTHLPIMLSEAALMELNELLSAKTKEELDRFRDEFLGLPPELRELLKDRAPVFV